MKFPIKTIKRNNQIVALPKNTSEVSKLVKFAKKIKYHILRPPTHTQHTPKMGTH